MLESAIDSPMNHKNYGQTDLFQLAGILAEKVILNHPYQDGNKRTALFAADMFLKINGYQLQKRPMEKGLLMPMSLSPRASGHQRTSGITMPVWLGPWEK
ncbi:DOC family protein, partial [Metarhizium hybridum]